MPNSLIRIPRSLRLAAWLPLVLAAEAMATEIEIRPPTGISDDATPIIAEAIERAIATGATRVSFAPGIYRIERQRARERFTAISNHDAGLRRTPFPIWGARDLEIDGHGARLEMTGTALVPFMIHDSTNVTVRNFTIDWAQSLCAQATVVAVEPDDNSVEVQFTPESGARIHRGQVVTGHEQNSGYADQAWQLHPDNGWRQNLRWTHWLDPKTRQPLPADQQLPQYAFSPWNETLQRATQVEQTGTNRFRIRFGFEPLPAIGTAFVAKGMLSPNRTSPAIHIAGSKDVTLEDIVIHHAGGMGVIAESSADVTLRRVQVKLPDDSERLFTTTADATHFSQCEGTILIEDCLFENMLDDAINVHGVHAVVDTPLGANRVGIRLSHFQQRGLDFVRPGELVRFCRRETLLPYMERTVSAVKTLNDGYIELTFTADMSDALKPDSVMDNVDRQPDLIFRHNTVRHNRGRGVLATTEGKVLIEDNRFEGCRGGSMGVTILFHADANVWHESGRVQDVTIRHNTFLPLNAGYPVISIQPRHAGEPPAHDPYHHNVRIEENTFRVHSPALLAAHRVDGLQFVNNTVDPVDEYTDDDASNEPAFTFEVSDNITISGNAFNLPETVTIKPITQVKHLIIKDNSGLRD